MKSEKNMRTVDVHMTVKVPVGVSTDEQVEEWIKFCVGYNGECSMKNPLHDFDLDAIGISIRT